MAISYIALFTGFYVDNGANLPLWNLLPPLTYWLLPSAVGIALLLTALRRQTLLLRVGISALPLASGPDTPTKREAGNGSISGT